MSDRGYRALLSGAPLWDEKLTDQKPPRRVKADQNEWVRLRKAKLRGHLCRICKRTGNDFQLHHVVPRGMGGGGGDDVADNLVALCPSCHGLVEARDPWARSLLGQRLTEAERAYVIGKVGAEWLARHYGLREAAA